MALYYRRALGQSDQFAADHGGTTQRCQHCAAWIDDDLDKCPFCGMFASSRGILQRRPWWFVVAVAVCLAIVLMWTFQRM